MRHDVDFLVCEVCGERIGGVHERFWWRTADGALLRPGEPSLVAMQVAVHDSCARRSIAGLARNARRRPVLQQSLR